MAIMLTGTDIAVIRTSRGMNLREFAEFIGVSEATVSRWEADKRHPTWKMMMLLNELATGKDDRNGKSSPNGRPRKEAASAS